MSVYSSGRALQFGSSVKPATPDLGRHIEEAGEAANRLAHYAAQSQGGKAGVALLQGTLAAAEEREDRPAGSQTGQKGKVVMPAGVGGRVNYEADGDVVPVPTQPPLT